jgi:hypothetical protein
MTKKSALISGLVFAALMSVFYSYEKGNIKSGIVEGIISGILYAFLMYFTYNSRWFKRRAAAKKANADSTVR